MEEKLIEAIIGLIVAVTIYIKARSEVNEVKADREKTKAERDTKIALLEQKCKFLEGRLDEGANRFDKIDVEIKSMNERFDAKMEKMSEKLTTIITKFVSMIAVQKRSHTPEDRT